MKWIKSSWKHTDALEDRFFVSENITNTNSSWQIEDRATKFRIVQVFTSNVPQLKTFSTQDTLELLSLTQRHEIQARLEEKWRETASHKHLPFPLRTRKLSFGKRKRFTNTPDWRGIPGHFLCQWRQLQKSTASFAKKRLDTFFNKQRSLHVSNMQYWQDSPLPR